jgi:hypothetical protein
MGLDNIPSKYPCEEKGIASLTDDGRIDCDLTKANGNCPWKNEYEKAPILKEANPTYGMLGTSCWYRGKYGNWLLGLLEGNPDAYADTKYSFYGEGIDKDDQDSEGMSVDYCLDMHEYMKENTEEFAYKAREYVIKEDGGDEKELINDWLYATWWTKFAAEYCEGSSIWY